LATPITPLLLMGRMGRVFVSGILKLSGKVAVSRDFLRTKPVLVRHVREDSFRSLDLGQGPQRAIVELST